MAFMQVNLSPADEHYIKEVVRNGVFPSEEEAVATAITRMRQEAETSLQRLKDAIQLGKDDMAAGRTEDYTPELLSQIFEEAVVAVERGEKLAFDPHVIP
jgi:putative addiction module CopG family antidote